MSKLTKIIKNGEELFLVPLSNPATLLLQIQTDYKFKKAQREKAELIKKEVTPHAA